MELDWYDYGARMYDPSLGRWFIRDPKMEWNFSLTPYHYVRNNPILYIDLFGLQDTIYISPEPIQPVYIKPETKWQKFIRKFKSWWKSGWDPIVGNHYEKKTRDSYFDDDFILKHFNQNEERNLGEAFAEPRAEPTNRNTVRSDVVTPEELETAQEMITPDQKILESNMCPAPLTLADGRPVKKIITKYYDESWKGPYRDSLVQYYNGEQDSLYRYFYNEDSTRISTWGPDNTVVIRKYRGK